MRKIKTIDLITLNNVAKLFKFSHVYLFNNRIIESENICFKYSLQFNLEFDFNNAIYTFSQRDLAGFVKLITIESEFEIKEINGCLMLRNELCNAEFVFIKAGYNDTIDIINKFAKYTQCFINPYIDKTMELGEKLNAMRAGDGKAKFLVEYLGKQYLMFLFSGLFDIAKKDKLSMSLLDYGTFFTCDFVIIKKGQEIHNIINFSSQI